MPRVTIRQNWSSTRQNAGARSSADVDAHSEISGKAGRNRAQCDPGDVGVGLCLRRFAGVGGLMAALAGACAGANLAWGGTGCNA